MSILQFLAISQSVSSLANAFHVAIITVINNCYSYKSLTCTYLSLLTMVLLKNMLHRPTLSEKFFINLVRSALQRDMQLSIERVESCIFILVVISKY